jgi:hypothetical protein
MKSRSALRRERTKALQDPELYFPMRLTQGFATRYGRATPSLNVARSWAVRAGNGFVVDQRMRPVWVPKTPAMTNLRIGVIKI